MVIKNFVHVGGMPQHRGAASHDIHRGLARPADPRAAVMQRPVMSNMASIPNGEERAVKAAQKPAETDYNKRIREASRILKELEDKRETLLKEYDVLKELKIQEGEEVLAKAKKNAAQLKKETEEEAKLYKQGIEEDRERILTEAMETGYDDGFKKGEKEGHERGYSEGYDKGRSKCYETMQELLKMNEQAGVKEDELFARYENYLFDAIFTICQKITRDSLKQKDKAVISKLLKETAKQFRSSDYVKVTLSALDISAKAAVELELFKELFDGVKHVEFEILKDAPSGTFIADDATVAADSSVATQLDMIRELANGRFRNMEMTDKAEIVETEESEES